MGLARIVYKSIGTLKLFKDIIQQGFFKSQIEGGHNGICSVMVNGPSLKEVLPNVDTSSEEFNVDDFIVVNYFAENDVFWRIKPKHYCFADPMFFESTFMDNAVKSTFAKLEKVDWPMTVYIPKKREKQFKQFANLKNEQLKIATLNFTHTWAFDSVRFWAYKKGYAMPPAQNVSIFAIYVALNLGYKEIHVYGVDHTFFDSMCVNDDNVLCNRYRHFYDSEPELKPIRNTDAKGKVYKVADYVYLIGSMFKSHDMLASYAEYLGTRIINYTRGSLIDSYTRISQIEKQSHA